MMLGRTVWMLLAVGGVACGPSQAKTSHGDEGDVEGDWTGASEDSESETTGESSDCPVDIASNASLTVATAQSGSLEAAYAWWGTDEQGDDFVALTATLAEVAAVVDGGTDVVLQDALYISIASAGDSHSFRFHGFMTSVTGVIGKQGEVYTGSIDDGDPPEWSIVGSFQAVRCAALAFPSSGPN
jgi:hypothetical protein